MSTVVVQQQYLADMVREDGHEISAILIEESTEFLLPSVLYWVAQHCKVHRPYKDEAAKDLVDILLWESALRREARR